MPVLQAIWIMKGVFKHLLINSTDVLYRESHNAYVCAIFEQRYVFNDAYLDSLIDSFPDLFKSREEARQLLYMKRYDEDALGAAPLAKLTHDIDEEISRLYAEKHCETASELIYICNK